jgi:putative endonuclease
MINDLARRLYEPKRKLVPGFTARYNIDRLLHYECFDYVDDAIAREKEIKRWRREKKERLVAENNPGWEDRSWMILDDDC